MFECLPGCGQCCGCIPIHKDVINRNRMHLQKRYRKVELEGGVIHPQTSDGKCIFLHRDTFKCQIYPERPEVCIKYGVVSELLCVYIDLEGKKRTEEEVRETLEYKKRTVKERLDKWLSRGKASEKKKR